MKNEKLPNPTHRKTGFYLHNRRIARQSGGIDIRKVQSLSVGGDCVMTPWRMGYLVCPEYNYPHICQLGEYESSWLKRYVIGVVDYAILNAMRAG